jgi:glutamine---fructose-6-phosphate transaminase (isomerizing)
VFDATRAVQIVACGTSHHAAQVARYWIEKLARIPCHTEIASEYRYRSIRWCRTARCSSTISQSGETMPTRWPRCACRAGTAATSRGPWRSATWRRARWCASPNMVLMTRAGPEIGVASTKAFTTQLIALALLTLALARMQGLGEATRTPN